MKSVEDYMNLPYNCIVQQINDESGTYFYAHVLELDGCQSTGETFKEAYESLKDAMRGWIETKIDDGFDIKLIHTVRGMDYKLEPLNVDVDSGMGDDDTNKDDLK